MNIFHLPPDFSETIIRRTLLSDSPSQPLEASPVRAVPQLLPRTTGVGCVVCVNAAFTSVEDQRSHYKSDWHRYNVKAKLSNKPLLSEHQFENAVAGKHYLSDSISGSESTDSDPESDDSDEEKKRDTVNNALRKAQKTESSRPASPDGITIPRSPIIWFHSKPATQLGVYAAVFPTGVDTREYDYVKELKAMQDKSQGDKLWTLLMTAGGHFAGIVVRVSHSNAQHQTKTKGKHKLPEYEVMLHKTFHRYTTRRKQGGSQSVNDNAKGPAKSAGAQLRRYGEQALKEDIRGLMTEWKEEIGASERIWIRASVSNKKIFYDYDSAAFLKGDNRLRSFPFPTRRPTQAELLRCLNELLHAKMTHFTEEQLRKQDEDLLASLPKSKPVPTPTPKPKEEAAPLAPKLTKGQEDLRENWKRILEMTKKGRLEALVALWDKIHANLSSDAGIDTRIPIIEGLDNSGNTLLQVASAAGQETVVQWLLEERGADPTVKTTAPDKGEGPSSEMGKTPYELASTKPVRDVFRRLAGAYPNRWDWLHEGRVPSVLSKEMEEEQDNKKKERRKGLKEKLKEREERQQGSGGESGAEDRSEKPVEVKPSVGPQRLGGASDAGGVMGLSPEMRTRIERERRARAIEARMQGNKP